MPKMNILLFGRACCPNSSEIAAQTVRPVCVDLFRFLPFLQFVTVYKKEKKKAAVHAPRVCSVVFGLKVNAFLMLYLNSSKGLICSLLH